MKPFRTLINAGVSKHTFGLSSKILTTGSCFADAIGRRLRTHKVHTLQNPFGTTYNPHSIHKSMKYALFNEAVPEHTFLQNQNIWLSYDFHSEFSSEHKEELYKTLRETLGATHYLLKDVDFILITYGTAWVYEHIDTGEIVANCHKIPAREFEKRLISQKQMIESFDSFYKVLKSYNPKARIVLTVSPVRHIKDTLEMNSVSKSILRTGCHTITETYPEVDYFPAYEIMMDDLRDYRFYKPDMLHPTEEAEDYIWSIFTEKYADSVTQKFFEEWDKILTALAHKPFHPSSAAHQDFIKSTLEKLQELKKFVSVEEEESYLKAQLLK